MADDVTNPPGPFDVVTVKALVALMSRFDLHEIDLRQGEARIRLLRGAPLQTAVSTPPTAAAALAAPVATPAPAKASFADKPAASAKALIDVKAPTVGTFYAKPDPNAQPFVKLGSKVKPDTVVCLIEAMKIYNEITADCAGSIAEILVENNQAVEYGQILFRVDPAG